MPKKKTAKKLKANKKIISKVVEETKKLPPRPNKNYEANMDNVIFEGFYKEGSDKDEAGKYRPHYLREVEKCIVKSIGPVARENKTLSKLKVGAYIIPSQQVRIEYLEADETGFIGSIKPHNIVAILGK